MGWMKVLALKLSQQPRDLDVVEVDGFWRIDLRKQNSAEVTDMILLTDDERRALIKGLGGTLPYHHALKG